MFHFQHPLVYNLMGQKYATLMNRTVSEGVLNRVEYQPKDLVPGVYIYRLLINEKIATGKIVYNK